MINDCPTDLSSRYIVGKRYWTDVDADNDLNKDCPSAKMLRWDKMYSLCSFTTSKSFQGFVLDSGSTSHLCFDKRLFSSLKYGNYGDITVASGAKISAKGIGTINLIVGATNRTMEFSLLNVLYVPDAHTNLVSINKMTQSGMLVFFSATSCFLDTPSGRLRIGTFSNGLYTLILPTHSSSLAQEALCVHEWHRKLSHRNLADVRNMSSAGLSLKKCNCSDICDACLHGKMSRIPFPQSAEPRTRLECIVSDLCGPMQTESVSRSKYFMTFTDVFSGYTEVSFLRGKDEAPRKAMDFIERIINTTGITPKIFRSDRGTEFTNQLLQSFLSAKGIQFECTAPYTPQQNGIAERKNRTLVEAAKTMLFAASMPNIFWAEAVHHAADTFNRILKRGINKSPYELIFNKLPHFEFHEFGCDVFVLVPKSLRKKLDDKAEKMRFVGFDLNSKAYRVVNKHRVVKISRDVRFVATSPSGLGDRQCEARPSIAPKVSSYTPAAVEINQEPDLVEFDFSVPSDDTPAAVPGLNLEPDVDRYDFFMNYPFADSTASSVSPVSLSTDLDHQSTSASTTSPAMPLAVESTDSEDANLACIDFLEPSYGYDFVLFSVTDSDEPNTFNQAMKSPFKDQWLQAMKDELSSIQSNDTWELVDLPEGRKSIGCKWVFKIKRDQANEIARFKARLVAQGFSQRFGVDYDEVFAPVARSTTLRILLSYAGKHNFLVKHFDVKTAFLNGHLDEAIYMRQPQGFQDGNRVLRLKKSLYGLKQAARVWNSTLHNNLTSLLFTQNDSDKCLYVLREREALCFLIIHVDDLLFASNSLSLIDSVSSALNTKFELKDLGFVRHYLGIDIGRDSSGNFLLSQERYITKIVSIAGLNDAKGSKIPLDQGYFKFTGLDYLDNNHEYRQLIGMLLYLTTHSRPDVAACVNILSQCVSKPRQVDLLELRRVIRYLKSTATLKLRLSYEVLPQELFAYSDANWAECPTTRKSNTCLICFFNGGPVSWCCRKQTLVTCSSTEAEYVALSETCKEVIWIKKLIEMFATDNSPTLIFTDSQSCIKYIDTDKFSNRSKHIDIKRFFAKDCVSKKLVHLVYIETAENIADLLTKPLGAIRLAYLRSLAGLIDDVPPSRGRVGVTMEMPITDAGESVGEDESTGKPVTASGDSIQDTTPTE